MPKAKPKVPKTEKMWVAWDKKEGGYSLITRAEKENQCRAITNELWYKDDCDPVRVRIVPEAEYQRLIAASKRIWK